MIGSLRLVGYLFDFAADSFLAEEFHYREEIVGIKTQLIIELIKDLQLLGSVIATISDISSDHGIVLLFYKTVVVLAAGPGSCGSDVLLFAVPKEMVIYECSAIIRVNSQQWARQIASDMCESFENPELSLIADSTSLRPSGADVGDIQGLTEVT